MKSTKPSLQTPYDGRQWATYCRCRAGQEHGGCSGGMRGLSGATVLTARAGATNQYWGTRVCPLPGLPALECAQCHSPHGSKRSWAHLPEVLSGKPRTFLPRVLCRVRPAVRTARLRTFLRLSPLCDSLSPRPLLPAACTGAAKSTGQTLYIP